MDTALHAELQQMSGREGKWGESARQHTVLAIFDVTEDWKDLKACRLSDWLRPPVVMAFATTPAHCSVPCVATGRSTSATADTARRARAARHLQHSTA